MSSIREQIVEAAVDALTTDRPAEIPEPVRTRLVSPRAAQLPALTVYQGREVVSPMRDEKAEERSSRGAVVRRALDLQIEVVTLATKSGDPADKLADPILCWAVKSIVGSGTFNKLLNDPADEAGTLFDYEQSKEGSFCRATMTVRCHYQSKTDDAELIA